MYTTTTESPQYVRDQQSVTPDWMEKILTRAEAQNTTVEVTRLTTPFGTYVTELQITPPAPNSQDAAEQKEPR